MFFGNNVQDTRRLFYLSWEKHRQGQSLLALEQQLTDVILAHPEYHLLLEQGETDDALAYVPELGQTNPFLHMGLHLAVRDQIATDRPVGISRLFQQLLLKYGDRHRCEHLMMDCLAECLWQAQQTGREPDEQAYGEAIIRLL